MALATGLIALVAAASGHAPFATATAPVVYVQAGHQAPREPGYRAQTGARGEQAFTARISRNVENRLRKAGVEVRHTAGKVTPNPADGAVFISIHYDTPTGHAAVGHAVSGAGENYYHGEGSGTPSSTPYADSAPHRSATAVSPQVQAVSRRLATRLATRYAKVFTPANGARSGRVRLEPIGGNRRMMRYYGYYRSTAQARVLIECGAVGRDGAMLRRTEVIGAAIADALVAHLKAERQL